MRVTSFAGAPSIRPRSGSIRSAALHPSSWNRLELGRHEWLRTLTTRWRRLGDLFARTHTAFRARYEGLLEPQFLAIAERLADDLYLVAADA